MHYTYRTGGWATDSLLGYQKFSAFYVTWGLESTIALTIYTQVVPFWLYKNQPIILKSEAQRTGIWPNSSDHTGSLFAPLSFFLRYYY